MPEDRRKHNSCSCKEKQYEQAERALSLIGNNSPERIAGAKFKEDQHDQRRVEEKAVAIIWHEHPRSQYLKNREYGTADNDNCCEEDDFHSEFEIESIMLLPQWL